MNKKERFDEAIERMKLLKLDKQCIKAFTKGKVWESEGFGALYEVNDEEQFIIDKFEAHHEGCLVYHMIHNKFEFGECYSILYVSPDTDEWQRDKDDAEWIKLLDLEDKVSKINSTDLSNEEKEDLIDSIIDKALDKYEDEVTYTPREKYIKEALASNREQAILDLITEIRGELNND